MPVFMVANYTDLEGAEGTELTDPQEKRRNGDERSFLEHEGHEDHKSVWPFDWPPESACRDVRGRRYKPPIAPVRFVSTPSYIAAVGARSAPMNRTANRLALFLRCSCETVP